MSIRPALALLFCLALTACGGGGGGDSAVRTAGGDLRIGAVSPASIERALTDLDVSRGIFPPVVLDAPFVGTASGTVFLVVEDPDLVLETPSISQFTDHVSLEFSMHRDLPIGRYSKPVVLHACKDAACREEFAGSPQTIGKDVTVTGLALSTGSLTFTSTAALAPAAQAVTVTPPAGLGFSVDTLGSVEYISPQGIHGVLQPSEVFRFTRTGNQMEVQALPASAGRYLLHLFVSADAHLPRTLDIEYQVGPAVTPLITALTPSVAVSGPVGNDVLAEVDIKKILPNLRLAIATPGTPDPVQTGWMIVSRTDTSFTLPSLPADVVRFTLKLNACGYGIGACLSAGTYNATLRVTGSELGVDTVVDVPVTFTVGVPVSPPPAP